MMTPIDCESPMSPAETKPTTSTVVTEDDWMIDVIRAPAKAAEKRLAVSRDRSVFIPSPATVLRASVI